MPREPQSPENANADRARLARGLALTLPAALLGIAAAVRLDAWLNLSAWSRGLLALGWLGAVGVAAWGWSSAPPRPLRRSAIALLAAMFALLSLVLVPAAGERVRRLFLPFYSPLPDTSFRFVVSSGDPVVKRGDPVTLTAFAEPSRLGGTLPDSAWIVWRDHTSGVERRSKMLGGGAAFHLSLAAIESDFEYRIEAETVQSDWHTVAVVDPVELAPGSTITVEAPEYATGTLPPRILPGFPAFDGLRFGRAEVLLVLARPAVNAYLEWRPDQEWKTETGGSKFLPVRLNPDHLGGSIVFPLETSGTLKLVLIGAKNFRTEHTASVRVVADQPPRFETLTGLGERPWTLRPGTPIPLNFAVRDDVAVAGARVEVQVNDTLPNPTPVTLVGSDTPRAEGHFTIPTPTNLAEGDTIRVRVVASDNRRLPARGLVPHETTFPPMGWAVFRVTESAPNLVEQEIHEQRDRTKAALAAVETQARTAANIVRAIGTDSRGEPTLTLDQRVRLSAGRDHAETAGTQLERHAAAIERTPDLQSLAAAVRAVAGGPIREARDSLRAASTEPNSSARDALFTTTTTKLDTATTVLAGFIARADAASSARLARHTIRELAAQQTALATPTGGTALPADWPRIQREIRGRLLDLLTTDATLNAATTAAEAEVRRKFATDVRALADAHRELSRAIEATHRASQQQELVSLAERQSQLNVEFVMLARRTDMAVRLAAAGPLAFQPIQQAVRHITNQRLTDAAAEQEKAARELERLTDVLTASAEARADPKETVRQLVRWQTDLRQRVRDAGTVTVAQRKLFAAEQQEIRGTTERLKLPPGSEALIVSKAAAVSRVAAAIETPTPEAMQSATDALAVLAEQIPPREQRLKETSTKIEALRQEQDAIARFAEEAVKIAEKQPLDGPIRTAIAAKATDAAERQERLVAAVVALDAPGWEHRLTATVAAARRAAADLRDGLATDIPVSQLEVRRQLQRFRQATDGLPLSDETAMRLTRSQRQLAEISRFLPDKPPEDQLKAFRQAQRDVLRQVNALLAPEAVAMLTDARDAVYLADQATRNADLPVMRTQMQFAAESLGKLADRLMGVESDLARVERLATERAAAVTAAKIAPRTPPTAEETAETARRLQRAVDDLDGVRVGNAQQTRRKATEALAKLRQTPDADRRPELQQLAADALRQLAEQMRKNADRSTAYPLPAKPPFHDPADPKAAGGLATTTDATTARTLSKHQRDLRDAVSQATTSFARGARPGSTDPLGDQYRQQTAFAAELTAFPEAKADAILAATRLKLGRLDATIEPCEAVERRLRAIPEARSLADRQTAIRQKILGHFSDIPAIAARQRHALMALSEEAEELAKAAEVAALRCLGTPESERLREAADSLRAARSELVRAGRSTDVGRAEEARTARQSASSALTAAASNASLAAPTGPIGQTAARTALATLRRAEARMRELEATPPAEAATTTTSALRELAEWLTDAARVLTPLADGVAGEPGS